MSKPTQPEPAAAAEPKPKPREMEGQRDGLPTPERYFAIIGIWFGLFLSVMNNSIANVSLPTIATQLGISAESTVWVVNAYQLTTIMFLLPFASLGEIVGYRRIYLYGVVLFTASSIFCALAPDFGLLIAARAIQGVASAMISSVNATLVRLVYPTSQLGRGLGLNASVVAISAAAGPAIAGMVLQVADWHVLFAVNAPFGLLAFALGFLFLPKAQPRNPDHRFAPAASVLNAITFALLVLTIESFAHGWPTIAKLLLAAGLVATATIYIRHELGQKYPLLPFDLLRIKVFAMSVLTSILSFWAQMLALVSLPFVYQGLLQCTESQTGFLMTIWPLAIMISAPLSGLMAERVHPGLMGGIGLWVFSGGLALMSAIGPGQSWADIIFRLALCGIGFALFQSPNNSLLMRSAPKERSGSASGMISTARLAGQTLGASSAALLFWLDQEGGPIMALSMAALLALAGGIVSFARLRVCAID